MRDLSAGLSAATMANTVAPVMLVELHLDSGPVLMWSGVGTLRWNGADYIGAGNLLGISTVTETTEVKSTGVDLSLSGVPSSLVSLALNEKYSDRVARILIGAMDVNSGVLISDPYALFVGRIDTVGIEDSGTTSLITCSIESRLIDLERSRERRFEDKDQQIDWPGDRFFEFVPSIQQADIVWGRTN